MSRDVGVGELVDELEQRGDRLPFEIGAFVALEACEGLLQESVKLEPDDVRVTIDGAVVVADSAATADPDEAARSLVSVLARLLVAAGPGVPPYLLQLVKESTTGQSKRDLRELHDAIEASLIPINRGASRRVLARLVRESDRPPAPEAAGVDPHELDAQLDELLRDPAVRSLEPEPARPAPPEPVDEEIVTERIRIPRGVREEAPSQAAVAPAPAVAAAETPLEAPEPITATIRKWQPDDEPAPERVSAPEPVSVPEPVPVAQTVAVRSPEPEPETATEAVFSTGLVAASESIPAPEPPAVRQSRPAEVPEAPRYDRASLPQQPPKRRGGWGIWLLVAALGVGVYALIATDALSALLRPAPPAPEPSPGGAIDVRVTPADAQIFVYLGRGPTAASGLAVDGAHEFIVFDDGLSPSRAIVPTGARWVEVDSGPLYELAVQAPAASGNEQAGDLGEPRSEPIEAAAGSTGTIRVITNPPGAKVYRYIGRGPTAQISVPTIHEGQEVLIYHPAHETRRFVIGPSDWREGTAGDGYGASLAVELPPLAGSAPPQTTED